METSDHAVDAHPDALVAHLHPGAHPLLSGRWGTPILLAPGIVMIMLGITMTLLYADDPASYFFGAIVIGSGVFAASSGMGIRRLALARLANPPVAFALDPDGVWVNGRIVAWEDAKFWVDDSVDPPMVICGGGKAAWRVDRLDTSVIAIEQAIERFTQ
ncbi:hypothetical protein [Propioniferax innocua]|uniref:Uncharacterized protein n=1 Tax=Propioniferax innocua TaxID=1753 RepID=A0A542ZDE0_9ACTN|nr:hypothetical protein [Propioniferax innocua]TQL58364.1 hypothetical protein FB460_2225 [Propioniferax innocua]